MTNPHESSKNSKRKVEFLPWQWEALTTKCNHFAMLSGIACGKTFTGSHFAINMFVNHTDKTGLIGANTYNQLSQATLAELFLWLEEYGFEYICDRKPPWKGTRRFKSYENILSVKVGDKVAHAFTRVLSDANPLRGLNISWAWADESRDTPENTHDVILSRMRETFGFQKTLVTTTTAGEDWVWRRFVKNADGKNFGYVKARTEQMLGHGLISQEFYDTLRSSYSPAMAAQELDAEFVNVLDGRSYYAASAANYRYDFMPDLSRPLIVACDFNFSPAPLTWCVGQITDYGIHWEWELSAVEVSTESHAVRLSHDFSNFFLRFFGDASGNRGTSSNAGETDYMIIANVMQENGVLYSIETDDSNPRVRDRVENTNRMLCNARGDIQMTYNPNGCPLLHDDFRKVHWKNNKLCGGDDPKLTHASDAAGYACWKLFPPHSHNLVLPSSNLSQMREGLYRGK